MIYEVNENTNFLEGYLDYGDTVKTRVYENGKVKVYNASPTDIMRYSCEYFGSTLDGRQKGAMQLLDVKHKVPVIVEESLPLIFFPLCSPKIDTCSWVCFNNIQSFESSKIGTVVYFSNGVKLSLTMTIGMFENQYLRATKLKLAQQYRKIRK